MSSKELEESLSELQVGKEKVIHGENGENKSAQNDMSKGEVQVSCFTEDLHDVTLHFQIVKFSKQVNECKKELLSSFLFFSTLGN